jgi:hypothetical protein
LYRIKQWGRKYHNHKKFDPDAFQIRERKSTYPEIENHVISQMKKCNEREIPITYLDLQGFAK